MSIVIHEFAHGYMAYRLGDNTARLAGRLTLNPLKHLDPFGSVVLPLLLYFTTSGGFLIGWAKPVPYNPNNLKNEKKGTFLVSIVGILANLLIAIIFGLFIRFALLSQFSIPDPFYKISSIIVVINLILFLFNLIPIPPLDGFKIFSSLLPYKYKYIESFLEKWGLFLLLLFIIFIWGKVSGFIFVIFKLITGVSLM